MAISKVYAVVDILGEPVVVFAFRVPQSEKREDLPCAGTGDIRRANMVKQSSTH